MSKDLLLTPSGARSLCALQRVTFPDSERSAAVNMMPFIMGDSRSIPEFLSGYIPLIDACHLERGQLGKVGYLSVQESAVTAQRPSHRRPGIHTEKHPMRAWGGGWGRGDIDGDTRRDGIYMASTVANSCRAWDVHIERTGPMGGCEHLREKLAHFPAVVMEPNILYWFTDSAPHESLPLAPGTFRQWFRLVTHKVDLWYADHSTANPLGILPSCRIVSGDKFANGAEGVKL